MLRPGGLTIRGRKVPDAIGSDMHYSAFLAAPAADTDTYRAVQEDTAVTGVDWQAFHAWTEDDPDFSGVITIRDHNGVDVGTSTWRTPTDPAADQSLTRIGWHRTGPGSRTGTAAATHPSPASASQPSDAATRRAINPSSRAGDQLALGCAPLLTEPVWVAHPVARTGCGPPSSDGSCCGSVPASRASARPSALRR